MNRKWSYVLLAVALAACTESPTAARQAVKPGIAKAADVVPSDGVINQSNVTAGECNATEWHWIINGLASASLAPDHIIAHFAAPVGDVSVPFEKFTGGTAHYTWTDNLDGTLVAPYATATLAAGTVYLRFNLSHGPCGDGGHPQGSSVETVVEDGTNTAITSPIALGATVHDKAIISTDPTGVTLPAGSQVHFYFWTNKTCTGAPVGAPDDKDATGTSPVTVEGGNPQGPLGAGDYGYKAIFTSGDPALVSDSEGECEPFSVSKGELHISTTPHDASHNAITSAIALGSVVHDRALVTGEVTGVPKAAVQFNLFPNATCVAGTGASVANTGADNGPGTGERSASSAALGAGSYGYLAVQPSDANYNVTDDTGCEPFTVNKGTLHISTDIHLDPGHTTVTTVTAGSSVHDRATVTGEVASIPKAAVTFTFYLNSTCAGDGSPVTNTGADNGAGTGVRSASKGPLAVGSYAFHATQPSDANYDVIDDTPCEPLSVIQLGKTMGFWGNTNGVARIIAAGGYLTNAKAIGRGSNIDTQAEALKVLPLTLNACGKGTPFIFATGSATATKDCTVATGINTGTLNTSSAQTLALAYNLGLVSGYSGQTIGSLGCSAYLTASLTASSTVNDAFAAAVVLINNSAALGSTTQTQLGNMNLLLNCLNRES
jgi:hypothetical protein